MGRNIMRPRCLQAWGLIAQGWRDTKIADIMGIEPTTVGHYLTLIKQELGITRNPEINSRVKMAIMYFDRETRWVD
jgi:DNA-binding CsgD family transcriptional regulator